MSEPLVIKEGNNYSDIVHNLLMTRPEMRDNDRLIFAWIINHFLKKKNLTARQITGEYLIKLITYEKDFPQFESIRRVRAKLQERHPELRGELYAIRHGLAERVRQEIKTYPATPDNCKPATKVIRGERIGFIIKKSEFGFGNYIIRWQDGEEKLEHKTDFKIIVE